MAVTSNRSRNRPKRRLGGKTKPKRAVKRRSAAAAALATPLYRKRVVKSGKIYSRKRGMLAEPDEDA
ncbi:MAG TPA: hypothetical protein VNJ31_05530 [Methyloceanibacter sp.]|nr:hypothetical protein [Methyloceanibacter sp.]